MVEIRKVLVPCDFSLFSDAALRRAIAIARAYGANIVALHVIPLTVVPNATLPFYPNPMLLDPAAQEQIRRELRRFVGVARQAGVRAEVEVREGNPARQIVEMAGSLKADAIVIGTHGRGGFERLVLGSVTEKVIRKAPCPVLTVREDGRVTPQPFERILCPVDFSPPSLAAAVYAVSLAGKSDGQVALLNVLERMPHGPVEYSGSTLPTDRLDQEERVRAAFRTALPQEVRGWPQREELITWGRPAHEIVRIARERRADLIVMGVQGRGAIDLALFGSTTHEVVAQAVCPVLTVRPIAPSLPTQKPAATEAEAVPAR